MLSKFIRAELERRIAIENTLLEIIKRSATDEPFEYKITAHHRHKDTTEETYIITAKLKVLESRVDS